MYIVVILSGLILGSLILSGHLPLAVVVLLLPLVILVLFRAGYHLRIYASLLSLNFPLALEAGSKDAGTLTTFLIFLVGFIAFTEFLLGLKKFEGSEADIFIYFLLLLGFLGFLNAHEPLFTAFRYFYIFISSCTLFLLITKKPFVNVNDQCKYLDQLLNMFLIIGFIQSFIGILTHLIPETGVAFKIFVKGAQEGLSSSVTDDHISRLRTLMTGPEPTGEMMAVLAPLALYKYFTSLRERYLALYFVFAFTQILTATRSTAVLFVLGTGIVLYMNARTKNAVRSFQIIFVSLIAGALLLSLKVDALSGLAERFTMFQASTQNRSNFVQIMNRENVWYGAVDNIKHTGLIGHGFLPPLYYKGSRDNFHNLYMTVIYQFGWLGGAVFFVFLIWIYWRLSFGSSKIRGDVNLKFLIHCCLVSMTIFLINECKYEFVRGASYQQFIWALLAFFFFVSSIALSTNHRTS
jgi:hypothetical protein